MFVDTGQLPYWDESANHALVVVGLDEDYVYVHDPEFPNAPLQVSLDTPEAHADYNDWFFWSEVLSRSQRLLAELEKTLPG